MQIALPEIRYPQPELAIRFFDQVLEGARRLPGVQSAAVSNSLPFRESPFGMGAFIEGRPRPKRMGETPFFLYRPVSPDYFATLGIPVLKGRAFTPDDRAGRPRVCLINHTAAQRYFPNGDAIGQRLSPDDGAQEPAEIVGIGGDVKQNGLGADTRTELLVAVAQTPPFVWRANARTLTLIVRTQPAIGEAASIVPSLRDMVRRLDGTVPTYQVATMPQIVADSMATPQRYMFVVSAFGTIALALAALGIYGVMTFLVRQRTHEIGVRIALGAVRGDVLRLVFGRVMLLTVSGLAIGLALAFALARWLGTFLFEIKPTDAITYLLGGGVLFIVALLAAYLPAYRATRIDPVTALRS
jgi:putative ABC transport system permease protein